MISAEEKVEYRKIRGTTAPDKSCLEFDKKNYTASVTAITVWSVFVVGTVRNDTVLISEKKYLHHGHPKNYALK